MDIKLSKHEDLKLEDGNHNVQSNEIGYGGVVLFDR